MSGMTLNLGPLGYIGGALYSCGAGQILGVPGTIISLIVALVQKIAAAIWSCKETHEGKEMARKKGMYPLLNIQNSLPY
ncbi:MAG TPA: hypothetical protein VIH61_01275 [Waddliaceae bacterium]